jgi:hypothetical protein
MAVSRYNKKGKPQITDEKRRLSAGQHPCSAAVVQLMQARSKFLYISSRAFTDDVRVLALPVDTGNAVSNAIPI